jgi:uncharacterized membrane protein YfcA
MEFVVVCLVALVASGLTLFSGFGLGTMLLPAFVLFFPVELAVAMTAIVHLANNFMKLVVLGRHADRPVVLRFGVPAILAAFAGAVVLTTLSDASPVARWSLAGRNMTITTVGLVIAALILVFALLEMLPSLRHLRFGRAYLPLGGVLSGFFGGLSGHQGALRSAFLVRAGLSKEGFIATGVVISCLVDVTRLSVYAGHVRATGMSEHLPLLIAGILSAFAGVLAGRALLHSMTMKSIQLIVSVLLILIALGLGSGLI